jgi:hypothetical protein
MTWTVVYDNVAGAASVPYDWKMGYEYKIYAIEAHEQREVSNTSIYTIQESISGSDAGFMRRTNDGAVILSQSPTKAIQAYSLRGDTSKVIRVLERPLGYQLTVPVPDNDEQPNYHRIFQGSTHVLNIAWEYGCEYLLFVKRFEKIGPYNNRSFIVPIHVFIPWEAYDLNNLPKNWREAFHANIHWGDFIDFMRVPNTRTGQSIDLSDEASTTALVAMYKRRINTSGVADGKPNRWRRFQFSGANGQWISRTANDAKAFPWPDDKDFVAIFGDPKGDNELTSANFFVEKAFTDREAQMVSAWGWNYTIAQEAGSSTPFAVTVPKFNNRGYKQAFAWMKAGCILYSGYELLDQTPPTPEPPPIPPKPDCEVCLYPGSIWYQDALVPVQFISPPDWDSREYTYEWGGDIGNGVLFVQELLEDGRVARIRYVKELVAEDNMAIHEFDISCLVSDVIYSDLGITDTATAKLSFELPCIIENNNPDITIEDVITQELHVTHQIQQRIFLSEPYMGAEPLCVNWRTQDATAFGDLSVKALAKDANGLPFITVLESEGVRIYIDGAFPKWYNDNFDVNTWTTTDWRGAQTRIFTKNLYNWLKGTRAHNSFLYLGDKMDEPYNATSLNSTSFYKSALMLAHDTGAASNGILLNDMTAAYPDDATLYAYLNQFDCVFAFSSMFTANQVMPDYVRTVLDRLTKEGMGLAFISDHGDANGAAGFFRFANDFLDPIYGVRMKGSVDRAAMTLTVDNFIAQSGNHPLWTGMTGQFPSDQSEAYVDAVDQEASYETASGQVCFADGESEKVIDLTILGNTLEQDDRYFNVIISDNTAGTIIKDTGRVDIIDDDAEPCGQATPSGGAGVTETVHNLGSTPGQVNVNYQMFGVPDMMEIFYDGVLVATTGGFVSNTGTLTFNYPGPGGGKPARCMIRMTGSSSGTAWNYTMNCPV